MAGLINTHAGFQRENEEYIRQFTRRLTRAPKLILEAAVNEALYQSVVNTEQDSGNAAWHWTITGFRGADAGSGDPRLDFRVRYGQSPIGQRGDGGANTVTVERDVIRAGAAKIHDMIWRQGRVAISLFHGLTDGPYAQNANVSEETVVEATTHALEKARLAAKKATTTFEFGSDSTSSNQYVAVNGKI